MSTAGTPVQLTSRGHRTVDRINEDRAYGLKTASLLATEGSTSFYKISGATRTCLSVGASAEVGSFYGATCELPTPDRPVVDVSIVEATLIEPRLHFAALQGFAADAITQIVAVDKQGDVVGHTDVANNTFKLTAFDRPAIGFIAYNEAGAVAYREVLPSTSD